MNKYQTRRAYHRKKSITKALRKQKIAEEVYGFSYYNHLGQYSKGKIHCSCPMCRGKTKYNGYKISDLRKLDRLSYLD